MNTSQLARLHRKRAELQAEIAELDKQIAETLDPAAGEAPPPRKRPRPAYVAPETPVSVVDMQAARRVLERRGYAVREDS